MPPEGVASNIRVFIAWDDQTVFSGEDIKCRITFKNVAPGPNQARPPNQHQQPQTPIAERSRQPSPLLSPRTKPNNGLTPPLPGRGHRSTLSLSVPSASPRSTRAPPQQWTPPQWAPAQQPPQRPGHAHKRSLSIVSIGSAAALEDQPHANVAPARPQRSGRGHGRSASLQISPRGGLMNGPQSAALPRRPFGSESSPVFNHSFPPSKFGFGRPSGASTVPSTPSFLGSQAPKRSPGPVPDFKFPVAQSSLPTESAGGPPNAQLNEALPIPVSGPGEAVSLPARPKDAIPTITEQAIPIARILSTTSIAGGTPRSSGEFYSLSNNSSETLASEYVTNPLLNGRKPAHWRRGSGMSFMNHAKLPESLMMGYAQVQGSFTLDGSLINLGPFEAVKRKAVLGGQGGGVIGVETSRRTTGLLTGFGWGSISNSIGELLGGGELSSIKQMRGVASSRSIPLLSTPQSILFVDLQLGPGESRTYEYSFKLPKGLPPTHRGKAIKISYSLVIGTQRPGGTKEQQVRSVDVPFRVLGSVNSHGEILGHDLLSPYIILRDLARVQLLDKSSHPVPLKRSKPERPESTHSGFLAYVDELLNRPHPGMGLLSPTAAAPQSRRASTFEEATSAKEAIDLAILRSNLSSESGQSSNRFEIARNGRRVGVVMLARPAYKLGESVTMAIDFTGAEIPCYAIHAALETAERVEPTLALRSEASIHRVTRKVYGSSSEATLFSRRIVFNPTIPIGATPEFITTGLSLDWKIRIEFVVPSSVSADSQLIGPHPLLEEISRDDRGGLVMVAAENLECESFEVAVPLRVYGAVCNGLERLERDEAQEEGLVV
ncbi:Rgp1-domain-containing protein [Durotheca rogersii]|uniref:Rgp1-domain-containing protein n=1 Tax=Durotheca rogersii TaxID=419775 RepID=UPI0022212102|nr:Rgp1-domain-containing protein [Durotheca rogersii]KAI5863464.1 Rgp1-domain-containing protein [Durotheca rogersii]